MAKTDLYVPDYLVLPFGQTYGSPPGFLRRFRAIEQALALGVEITQVIDLEAVSQNAKQQVTGQMSGRSPPEHRVPPGPERTDIEFAQAHDLDVDCLSVWLKPTVLGVWHDGQEEPRLDWLRLSDLSFAPPVIW
jgi:hypothetical protein